MNLQKVINAWHIERFQGVSEFEQLVKLEEEISELASAIREGADTMACHMEMADVSIALMNLAGLMGCNLEASVMTKMGINLGREWECNDGVYHHV